MTHITYMRDEENGDYGALYIDGNLITDFETYEMDPLEVLKFLKQQALLANDVDFEYRGYTFPGNTAEFPDTIDIVKP